MRSLVYLLVFDGFADWEPALACAEVNKSPRYQVRTVGLSRDVVTSMAGLTIIPDLSLEGIDADQAAMLILPGGDMWEGPENTKTTELLRRLAQSKVPVALICGATIAGARAGLLDGVSHTSNFDGYLKRYAVGYNGSSHFREIPAVTDQNIVTASGMGSVEFAFEIVKLLGIYDRDDLSVWLTIYRDKVVPTDLRA